MATEISTDSLPCSFCRYPVAAPTYVGQEVRCSYCGGINKAIAVEIPTPLFVGVLTFIAGVVLGPLVLVSTKTGSEWLARKARERLER